MSIKDVSQISTKKGDKGSSKNYTNESFHKDDLLFETLGTIDELSANLGLAYHKTGYEPIKTIQKTLQAINALVATNPDHEAYQALRKISDQDIDFLEDEEAKLLKMADIKPVFHLPGSDTSEANAYFDLSRTITRRAERMFVRFVRGSKRTDLDKPMAFLNRLSDLLFLAARNFK